MLTNLLDTSIVIFGIKKIWNGYCYIEQKIDEIYKDSKTYRLIQDLRDRIKVYFRYSFFGRISQIKNQENLAVLDDSKVIKSLMTLLKGHRGRMLMTSETSIVLSSIEEIRKNLYAFPTKTTGFILILATIVNVALSVIFHKNIELAGWIVRGILLFVGIIGLFCDSDWQAIKNSSIIFRNQK